MAVLSDRDIENSNDDQPIYFSLELKYIRSNHLIEGESNNKLILSNSFSMKEGDFIVIYKQGDFELLEIKNVETALNNVFQVIGKVMYLEKHVLL